MESNQLRIGINIYDHVREEGRGRVEGSFIGPDMVTEGVRNPYQSELRAGHKRDVLSASAQKNNCSSFPGFLATVNDIKGE